MVPSSCLPDYEAAKKPNAGRLPAVDLGRNLVGLFGEDESRAGRPGWEILSLPRIVDFIANEPGPGDQGLLFVVNRAETQHPASE